MTGARKGTSHNEIYKETNWQTLAERRKTLKLKNFLKVVNHETPEYMQSLLPDKIGSSRTISCYADNFQIPKARTETFKQSFIPLSIKIYNETEVTNHNIKHNIKLLLI